MKNKIFKHILPIIMALVMCIPLGLAIADDAPSWYGSTYVELYLHSVETGEPIVGAEIQAWKIADYSGQKATVTDIFQSLGLTHVSVSEEGEETAQIVEKMILEEDNLAPDFTAISNAGGYAVFNSMPDGVYFFRYNTEREDEQRVYHRNVNMVSFIIGVPTLNEDGLHTRTIQYRPKCEIHNLVDVSVRKVWINKFKDAIETPDSIVVQLLDGEELLDVVEVTAEEDFYHEWWDLPAEGEYNVIEDPVPSGFIVSYENEGLDFVITNEARNPNIPLTGDNGNLSTWLIIIGGCVIILAGIAFLYIKKKKKH